MTEHTGCPHPFADHVAISHGNPLNGGVMVCPVPGCVCVSTWDVPQAMAGRDEHGVAAHRRALMGLQGAYRTLVARGDLPVVCSACGGRSWDYRDMNAGTCYGCRPTDSEPGDTRPDDHTRG